MATASLETRVKALETSGGRECPECRWDGHSPLEVVISWVGENPYRGKRKCGTCNRPIVITWEDAPD